MKATPIHLVIPDTQIEPGRRTTHLEWIGAYCHDRYAGQRLTRIMLGDWYNMGSLSSYDKKGGTAMEGRRYVEDVEAGNAAWPLLGRDRKWDDHYLLGNHENRIVRAYEADATLAGAVSLDHLKHPGWKRHGFLDLVELDGVTYSHYFYNPMTGRPYAGQSIENRLKTVGHSFTMGHQQTLQYGLRYLGDGTRIRGLVAGACYLHNEDYLGPQGNAHWRGIVVCHQVERGDYDLMEVSLDYLCRRYEGKRLQRFLGKRVA